MKTIQILIAPDRQSTVEIKGFFGNECLKASKFMEYALGTDTKEFLTREFYQWSTTKQQVNQEL